MGRSARLLCVLAIVLSFVAAPVLGQDRVRETREVASFTSVSFSVPGTLHLRQGSPQSVEVAASADALDHLETTVDNGTLQIQTDRADASLLQRLFGSDRDIDAVEAFVTVPNLDGVSLAGSGTIVGETPVDTGSFRIQSAGSGDVELTVTATDVQIEIAGSGAVRLQGTASSASVEVAGSGTVQAPDLTVDTAEIEIAGSGDVQLHVTDRLSAETMGSGDVLYRGSPTVETSITGSGEVRSMEP